MCPGPKSLKFSSGRFKKNLWPTLSPARALHRADIIFRDRLKDLIH